MRKEITESKTASKTIQARLFDSFKKHPDNIAIQCEGNSLTYRQLGRQSDFIANWLIAQGMERETFIGILVDDKISLVAVILGIIKAGCVFVPLDSHYPDRRIRAMLRSSEIPYIIIDADKREKLKSLRRDLPFSLEIITINEKFYLPGSQLHLKRFQDKYKLGQEEKTRYKRQMLLDGWGIEGQERLKGSVVFVAGAGGSGSPLIQQLALCGLGTIIICDFDKVELSNLNRQSLHDESRIGMNKALSAKMTVERMNPHIKVIARPEKITRENVFQLVGDAEIIFDNVDSLEAKSFLSECAVARGIPHIISSMIHINSYVCIFHTPYTPCFHCLYDKNKIEDIRKAKSMKQHYEITPNSVASPSLHLATGFAVNEAVKILLGFGKPGYNIYFHFNQYGSIHVAETAGYRQITYPFNRHFREISRKQGYDWETGWHGRHLEEIRIEPDPLCPVCSHSPSLEVEGTGAHQTGVEIHDEEIPPRSFYDDSPQINYLPGDKINIYFTSGTTGQPKAVVGKNEGMTHFIAWEINEFKIHERTRVSQMTSQCHDPFLRDIFVPLCAGGIICVPDSKETLLGSRPMKEWLETSRVNLVHCTPGLFKIMNADGLGSDDYKHLEYVLMAGEKIRPRDLEKWYRVLGNRVQLVNVYGPTETTLAKLFYPITPQDVSRESIPIGKPIPGAKVIILNKEMKVCGPGEVGEIYIRTPFRSYGYYKDPGLTAEKFIRNPFTANPEDIIYKTGDLGKINSDGNIEFVGREDRQVKIRGFRVELDEIEKRLRNYTGVENAVVLYRGTRSGNHILCAYFSGNGQVTVPGLKEFLERELPDYMVPSFYVKMEKFPLNANGKINSKALPEPDEVERSSYMAPKNEWQRRMVRIWTEILGIEKIGIHDGFLDMGGNSLNAMNLTSRIYREFNVNLPLSVVFENPTAAELVSMIKASAASIYQRIEPVEEREYYPLSSAQMRMFLLREFADEDDISYNQPKLLLLKGKIDKDRLGEAFKQLIARHDALRTGFEMIDGQPVQRIHHEVEFEIEYYDMKKVEVEVQVEEEWPSVKRKSLEGTRGLAPLPIEPATRNSQPATALISSFIRPFNLSQAPLLRVGLVKISQDEHILIFDIHHIISDGVTTGIFIDEMMKLYRSETLLPLPIQYKDYALWQQGMLKSDALKKQENHWLEVFNGEIPILNLKTDYPRPVVQNFAGAHLHFDVDARLVQALEQTARFYNATLYMVLLAAFKTLLYWYSGDEDLVVGSPIAGRPHNDLQNIPGVFINTLAIRSRLQGTMTFAAFLEEVKENTFAAYDYQDYPFEELVEKLDVSRNLARNPLFDVMFIFQNIDLKPVRLEGLTIEPYPIDTRVSKFDISLIVIETEKGLDFSVEYSTCLFEQITIERFFGHFVNILKEVVKNPQTGLNQVELLTEREKEQLIFDFNKTKGEYVEEQTIYGLFQETAEALPGKTALICKDKKLTYEELNRRTQRLAKVLRNKGVGPDIIVGLMVERSFEMIIGMFGILKAGGAYLPLDPAYPEKRKKYMLDDSGVKLLLSDNRPGKSNYIPKAVEIIDISQKSLYLNCRKDNKSPVVGTGKNLVYLIYTSGSTGKPKGVMLKHKNLVNLIKYDFNYTNMDFSKILQFHTLGFDASFHEIACALLGGGELYLIDRELMTDVPGLAALVEKNQINTLFFPMSFLKMIFNEGHYVDIFPGCTEHIQTAGEQVVIGSRFRCFLQGNNVRLHNHYGPSETHVVTALTVEPRGEIPELPSIGKPVLNTTIYILNRGGRMQPLGVPGELYIGGVQVGRGYLNRPELTAEKFVLAHSSWLLAVRKAMVGAVKSPMSCQLSTMKNKKDKKDKKVPGKNYQNHMQSCNHASTQHHSPSPQYPITPLPHSPIYKTGDLARWLADGNIEFLGRIDTQLKIRGFRVEPGEIESQLMEIHNIKEAVVVGAGDKKGEKILCAYFVSGEEINTNRLKSELAEIFPDYMIPAYFIQIEKMPLTPSGKVDRRGLPAPELKQEGQYPEPTGEIEKKLAVIWSEVLGRDILPGALRIGIDDNFFNLGGHSLTAMLMTSRIHKEFNLKISLAEIFKTPTIRKLARYMARAKREEYQPLEPTEEKEYYKLSFHQKRLWILGTLDEADISFHMPVRLEFDHGLDEAVVRKSLHRLLERHESMRTRFDQVEGIPYQLTAPGTEVEIPFEVVDISAVSPREKERERERLFKELAAAPFDFSRAPLFRAAVITIDATHFDLLFTMHHIISDGWSMEILKGEFLRLYEGYRSGKAVNLPALPLCYKDFTQWQNTRINDPGFKQEAFHFWRQKLSTGIPVLQLPVDSNINQSDSTGVIYMHQVPEEIKAKLKKLAEAHNTTLSMVLFTIFNILLAHISNQEDTLCALISAGRDHESLHHIVGYFTQSLLVKTRVDPEEDFDDLLQRVHVDVMQTIRYQDYPLELVLDELGISYPDVRAAFNMLNIPGSAAGAGMNIYDSHHQDKPQGVKFDLEVFVIESHGSMGLQWHYRKALFNPGTIESIVHLYIELLEELSQD
ncbi:MAG: amino acid adenylation domain-containing protein [Candidatus Aminicenantes bacterium]